MLYNDRGPIPGFEPRKKKKEISEESEENDKGFFTGIARWVAGLGLMGMFVILGIGAIAYTNSSAWYDTNTRECFSRLTTLDHSLLQESDPNALVKEIRKDIVKNHLVPLCGFTYENMDHKMISIFFPNVLFDPIGIQ